MPIKLGDTIADRYRIDGTLGEGGMGVVYSATHAVTRKHVALKVLRPDYAADARTRQRFLREARAACAVSHPNVVQIHDVIEIADGSPAIVMELLEGETLAKKLEREGALEVHEVARVMLPVLSAVGTAHELGIVHRDLKPENIFLAAAHDGAVDVKVLDFGIAKLTATEGDAARSGGLTGTGSMLGTPFYMSPEQGFGEKDIDHRADIWSLGVILYECLAGVRPTQADNIGQIFKIVVTDAIRPLATRMPGLPEDVTALVGKMLQRDRARRPADLREVVDVLARHAEQGAPAFGAPKSPLAVTLEGEGAALTMGALERPAVPSAATRRWRGAYATFGVVVAAAAGVGLWQLRGTPSAAPSSTPATPNALAAASASLIAPEPPSATAMPTAAPLASSSAAPVVTGSASTPAPSGAPAAPRSAVAPATHHPPPAGASSAAPAATRAAKTSIDPGSYQ